MSDNQFYQQDHGYRDGHQLLSSDLRLSRKDQDTVDRLSDMAGPLRPGETFDPYLTAYPLPSHSHYVVARTWQDLSAPRAGCVLTRSILVPMPAWQTMVSLDGLLSLLVPFQLGDKTKIKKPISCDRSLPKVKDPRTVELVEAVFLENRQPIVFFEAPEAEAITVRLLTALWPALRGKFAACSYTLSPRKIEGRYFDLVFAPKTARLRFTGYPARFIGMRSSNPPRHRWSGATSFQIFQSDSPNLIDYDLLGILKADSKGDESSLRLLLLWSELAAKANKTPTAVLGMLDILNSHREIMPQATHLILPVITNSVDMVGETLSISDAWRFLVTLVEKFRVQFSQQSVRQNIEQAACSLAGRNPAAAMEFIEAEFQDGRSIPAEVLDGLADGLGSSEGLKDLSGSFAGLPPNLGLSLVAASANFTRSAIAMAKCEPLQWIPILLSFLEAADRDIRNKVRQLLVPLVDDGALASLLQPVLEGISAQELADVAVRIGYQTKFDTDAFDELLGNAARELRGLEILRNAVVAAFRNEGAHRFLLSTLYLDASDVTWLCSSKGLEKKRARRLLLDLLRSASDQELLQVHRDKITRERTLECLLGDPALCASQLARIITLVEIPVEPFLELGFRIIDFLDLVGRRRLEDLLLERAFAEVKAGDKRVLVLVTKIGNRVAPDQLVRMATAETASSQKVGDNVVVLEAAPGTVRRRIVANIDELTDRLVNQKLGNLGEAAYIAWAAMIQNAGNINREAQIRASVSVLPFAFRLVKYPASDLIITTFPIVYMCLSKPKSGEDNNFLTDAPSIPLSSFPYENKNSKAALRDLVRDLVKAFLKSSWPPANLVLAVIDVGIAGQVLKRLQRKQGGDHYIREIERDGLRLKESARTAVQESLLDFRMRATHGS